MDVVKPRLYAEFLSTLSLRRATRPAATHCKAHQISIHALLAESDPSSRGSTAFLFSFLSTLSLRRATRSLSCVYLSCRHFYPRSPCGERQCNLLQSVRKNPLFLSTLSLRRATSNTTAQHIAKFNFYPRSPCGERRKIQKLDSVQISFLSTLSLRRATRPRQIIVIVVNNFYPRSPCGERPANWFDLWGWKDYFYPRSPCGERPRESAANQRKRAFLSTLSLRRATGEGE